MSESTEKSINWGRTRRNVIAIGGVLVGATFSLISKSAKAQGAPPAEPPASPSCFLRGTRVLTPGGERRIEDLGVDDAITTLHREERIEWIGRRVTRRSTNSDWAHSTLPVRIAVGALGTNVPHSDLWVSQCHALLIDGVLIRAADLVNGTSISIDSCKGLVEIEYLHIKLAAHDVIFAEGAPSETLLFNASNVRLFDNIEEYEQLYGPADIDGAPVVSFRGNRALIRSHFRSVLSPWIDRRTEFEKIRDRLQEGTNSLAA
jgi:hypothetical protein